MSVLIQRVTVVAAVGSGLVGGVFFAFSAFVMPALGRVSDSTGIRAMQEINRRATTPPLMIALFGTAAICAGLAVWAIRSWQQPSAPWTLGASLTYLATAVLVTAAANVPANDTLDKVDPTASTASAQWAHFLNVWNGWNYLRIVGCLVAAAGFAIALIQSGAE
jgi:uncharacterized membrane protein